MLTWAYVQKIIFCIKSSLILNKYLEFSLECAYCMRHVYMCWLDFLDENKKLGYFILIIITDNRQNSQ